MGLFIHLQNFFIRPDYQLVSGLWVGVKGGELASSQHLEHPLADSLCKAQKPVNQGRGVVVEMGKRALPEQMEGKKWAKP